MKVTPLAGTRARTREGHTEPRDDNSQPVGLTVHTAPAGAKGSIEGYAPTSVLEFIYNYFHTLLILLLQA